MEPRDQLFATLDVTAHAGTLPSLMKVIYVDTVGFISDIPTSLIDAFIATLEDVLNAVSFIATFEDNLNAVSCIATLVG